MKRPKRVAAIHDLSAFGRCSLSVALPVISAMGVCVCPVPTALLSTHTGGFTGFKIHHCDSFPADCLSHWRQEGLDMECIYSGFLGTPAQIDQVIGYIKAYPRALSVVDPVLGDNGVPYQTMTAEMIENMGRLVRSARLITPNPTEVSLLLNKKYTDRPVSEEKAKKLLRQLSELGPETVVITGIALDEKGPCNIAYSRGDNRFICIACNIIKGQYHGTGDVFSSVLTGALVSGDNLSMAVSRATTFVEHCLGLSYHSGEPARDGVFIEYALPQLISGEKENRGVAF